VDELSTFEDKSGWILNRRTLQSNVQQPLINVTAEYAPNTERTLRGLMLALGVSKEQIEETLNQYRERPQTSDTTEGIAH
jgi:hypothetical protein